MSTQLGVGRLSLRERHRAALTGIETADSLTIDAHKWFAVTMGCGMFFTRYRMSWRPRSRWRRATCRRATRTATRTSIRCSGRAGLSGLRLFLSLAAAGWDGYARHVEHAIGLAALLRDKLSERGWKIVNTIAGRRPLHRAAVRRGRRQDDRCPRPRLRPRLGLGHGLRRAPGCPRLPHPRPNDIRRSRYAGQRARGRSVITSASREN
jgi:glutamate/tyrosine decarboxylase-like PLP-dependent enzyme